MREDLEAKAAAPYRSRGEETIARFLDQYGLPFEYEPDIYLKQGQKRYIWHPDFYLPRQHTIIEYFGVNGDPDYDKTAQRKKRIYQENQYNFIPVYPATLTKNYQAYITKSIQNYLSNTAREFYKKTSYAARRQ